MTADGIDNVEKYLANKRQDCSAKGPRCTIRRCPRRADGDSRSVAPRWTNWCLVACRSTGALHLEPCRKRLEMDIIHVHGRGAEHGRWGASQRGSHDAICWSGIGLAGRFGVPNSASTSSSAVMIAWFGLRSSADIADVQSL